MYTLVSVDLEFALDFVPPSAPPAGDVDRYTRRLPLVSLFFYRPLVYSLKYSCAQIFGSAHLADDEVALGPSPDTMDLLCAILVESLY